MAIVNTIGGNFDTRKMRFVSQDQRIDRYLAIVAWARKRYTKSGRLTIRIGERLTRYSRIEEAAFARYITESAA